MASRIVTLTLNPSLDISADADMIRAVRKTRTRNERFDAGGGGVNVSRVLHELGAETLAIILTGGLAGALLEQLLEADGVPRHSIPIAGSTRMCHTVNDLSTRNEFRFVPEGPEVSEAEWSAALAVLEAEPGDWIVASGSLPRGVPDDFYVRVAELAARQGRGGGGPPGGGGGPPPPPPAAAGGDRPWPRPDQAEPRRVRIDGRPFARHAAGAERGGAGPGAGRRRGALRRLARA